MKRKKTLIMALSTLAALFMFAFLDFRGFVSFIQNQRTCDWANIDNIELHAHLDNPKVTKWDCDYEKESNIRKLSSS